MTQSNIAVSVWRGTEEGAFSTFQVPLDRNQTVLDTVTWIQRHADPTLSYRFACRVGMCGSCAMMVNGSPMWTCRTHVNKVLQDGRLEVAPLANLPVIKDLAVDMSAFFDKMARARGVFLAGEGNREEFATVKPGSPERQQADAGIECIGCGVCYAACDVVRWKPGYLGPAALNRAWTLVNDIRDGAKGRTAAVAGDSGCHACHSQQGCAQHCPKQINPTAAIAGLKRKAMAAAVKGEL